MDVPKFSHLCTEAWVCSSKTAFYRIVLDLQTLHQIHKYRVQDMETSLIADLPEAEDILTLGPRDMTNMSS